MNEYRQGSAPVGRAEKQSEGRLCGVGQRTDEPAHKQMEN
jgi:hypothetical protein